MLISSAHAQGLGDMFSGASGVAQFLPLVLIFGVFYFLLIRPQQQKQKELRNMISAVRRGDRVVTGGGIIGIVAKVAANDEVLIDIAENTRIRVLRSSISTVMAKPAPAGKADNDDDETKEIEVLPPAKDDQTP
jgi:preprotein translocase subunit YajC